MMTRRMMFASLLMPNDMTGCTLSSVPTASRSPRPKSQLPWSGTLIRLATGFCVCFASSSAVWAAAGAGRTSSADMVLSEKGRSPVHGHPWAFIQG